MFFNKFFEVLNCFIYDYDFLVFFFQKKESNNNLNMFINFFSILDQVITI